MNLDTFVTELEDDVQAFRAWWLAQHEVNPEHFPLEFEEEDNAGLWFEQFVYFASARPDQD